MRSLGTLAVVLLLLSLLALAGLEVAASRLPPRPTPYGHGIEAPVGHRPRA